MIDWLRWLRGRLFDIFGNDALTWAALDLCGLGWRFQRDRFHGFRLNRSLRSRCTHELGFANRWRVTECPRHRRGP